MTTIRRHAAVSFALLAAIHLTGCGGGSGSGATTPPISNNPPPTTNPPPPPPPTVSLTLTGVVTDAPIANAIVTATLGDQTFEVEADASGNYTLPIEIDEADADEFITLHAQGVGDQEFVVFTSLAGSFAALAEQAGDDDVLSNAENFATQITNVSTAAAVLMQEANDGAPITSDAQLQSVSATVDGQAVLDLATAIKLAVDSAADYPLPEGQSILDVVSDAETREQFVAENLAQDPAAFAATQTAIASDPALTQAVSAADVPATLFAASLSTDAGVTFNLYNRVSNFTFEADGTGTVAAGTYSREMTWSVEGSSLNVLFAEPVSVTRFAVERVCEGTPALVWINYASDGLTLTLLSDRTLAVTETTEIVNSACAELIGEMATTTVARTILEDEDFVEIPTDELAGLTMTLSVYDDVQGFVTGELAEFNGDGTGITKMRNKTFTWSVEEGRILSVTFDNGSTGRYAVLREVDEFIDDAIWEITTPSGRFSDAGAMVFAANSDEEEYVSLTAEDVPGRLYDLGYGNETSPHPSLRGLRFRFDPGGYGSQENDFLDSSGAVVTQGWHEVPSYGYYWRLEGEDLVTIQTPDCDPNIEVCENEYEPRRIMPLAAAEGAGVDGRTRLYTLDKLQVRVGGPEGPLRTFYVPHFYDYEPLSSTP